MSLDQRHSRNNPSPRTLSPSPHVDTGRRTDDPPFRVARARLGAYALHHKRPEIAVQAGRRGGEATSQRFPLGPKAWGVAMALARWHKTDFPSLESRAPRAGPGDDGGGIPEPGPAPALKTRRTVEMKTRRERARQGRLL